MQQDNSVYKLLPSVDKLLQAPVLANHVDNLGHERVKKLAQKALASTRLSIAQKDRALIDQLQHGDAFQLVCSKIDDQASSQSPALMVPVINLTGTVVHTNLGRAKLPDEAIAAMTLAAGSATNLEFDLVTGKRGDRDSHLENCLCEITGAEAATVVNNNAAAVVLVLNTLAYEKEVIISRGELVEIGGAFRIPDVMRSANSILKEVGTTNRTHLRDFENAISTSTGVAMKVHTSNYEIKGFTKSVPEAELAELFNSQDIPFVSDLGSGTLIDLSQYGLPHEPTVQETLASGADLVTFSGDKLLGGPQAGVIVGKKNLIEKIKQNPLKRALRVDKATLAALVEVINLYSDPHRLQDKLPILRDLTKPKQVIQTQAQSLLPKLKAALPSGFEVTIEDCKSQIGSGALPLDLLESSALVIRVQETEDRKDEKITQLSLRFRQLPVPVVGRLHDGALIFDLRCLQEADKLNFVEQLDSI